MSTPLPTLPIAGVTLLPADAPRSGLPEDIPPGALAGAIEFRDWLLAEGARAEPADMIAGFAERLLGLGLPVDRISTAIDALHSEYSGIGRLWTKGEGTSFRLFPHGEESDDVYARSPFRIVHETRRWLDIDLDVAGDDSFGIVSELKQAGYRHYLVIPLFFTGGSQNGISLATETPAGFGPAALCLLRFLVPTLSAALELQAVSRRLDNVLRIYVGDEPHREILSGAIQRGQVNRIRSAILFADMRGYTRITSHLSPEGAVELLNAYFDCLVPAIESEGGEVLKYLGDGLLAIFRDRGDDTGGTAQAALSAAVTGLVALEQANDAGQFPARIEAGIALHHGEAAYGNVGSGGRLDFTVIGPDVNLASRIARMNKVLGEPLLMSRAFANHLWGDLESLGSHDVDGFSDPVPIYRLRSNAAALDARPLDESRLEGAAALSS